MSKCQVNSLSSKIKEGERFNFSFAQNGERENIGKQNNQGNTAVHGDLVPGRNGLVHNYINCYTCQTLGYYDNQFRGQTGTNFSQTGIMSSQGQHVIEKTWLFLNTCLSNSVSNHPIME